MFDLFWFIKNKIIKYVSNRLAVDGSVYQSSAHSKKLFDSLIGIGRKISVDVNIKQTIINSRKFFENPTLNVELINSCSLEMVPVL